MVLPLTPSGLIGGHKFHFEYVVTIRGHFNLGKFNRPVRIGQENLPRLSQYRSKPHAIVRSGVAVLDENPAL